MRSSNRALIPALAALIGMANGGASNAQPLKRSDMPAATMVADAPVMLGPSYAVDGVTYTPADPVSYDEVGYASVAEEGSNGAATANGESFVASAITAAHKSLPLPSYVEVTALDSGRTILVRVNDRGPMRNDRIIALSPGAAAQLGMSAQSAPVRVRRVNPPDQDQVALRRHGRAAERLESPDALLKVLRERLGKHGTSAPPSSQTAPVKPSRTAKPGATFDPPTLAKPAASASGPASAATGRYIVQVGAFSSRERAETLAKRIDAHVTSGGGLWRVRFGPYPSQQAAQAGIRAAAAKGFPNARIMANDGQ